MSDDDRWHERRQREPRFASDDTRHREGFWGRGHDDDGFRSHGSRHYSREDYGSTGRGPEPGDDRQRIDRAGEIGRVQQGDGRRRDGAGGHEPRERHRPGPIADDRDRGFFERASDEVATWFGDDGAEHRREMDHRGRGPKGYRRSDARIQDDVSDRLADDRYVDATEIEVSVSGGEVTLAGTVDSRGARRRAEDLAEQVSGVTYVQNNLRLHRADVGFAQNMESARIGAAAPTPGAFASAAGGERQGGSGNGPTPAK